MIVTFRTQLARLAIHGANAAIRREAEGLRARWSASTFATLLAGVERADGADAANALSELLARESGARAKEVVLASASPRDRVALERLEHLSMRPTADDRIVLGVLDDEAAVEARALPDSVLERTRAVVVGDEVAPRAVAGVLSLGPLRVSLRSLWLGKKTLDEEGARSLDGLAALRAIQILDDGFGPVAMRRIASKVALESLTLLGRHVGDDLVDALAGARSLRSLHLNGVFTTRGVARIATLAQLEALHLTSMNLDPRSYDALASHRTLKVFWGPSSPVGDGGAAALGKVRSLRTLHLESVGLTAKGLADLKVLGELTELDVGENDLGDDAKPLAKLVKLERLGVRGVGWGPAAAAAIAELPRLVALHAAENPRLDAAAAKHLAKLEGLRELRLNDCRLGDEGALALARLVRLEVLELARNRVGAKSAKAWAKMDRLVGFDGAGNKLGEAGARALVGKVYLEDVNVGQTSLGPKGAAALAAPSLSSLRAPNAGLNAASARVLAELSDLRLLELSFNALGDGGAEALATLGELRILILKKASIGDAGAAAFGALKELRELDLENNLVEGSALAALATLPNLSILRLTANPVGDAGVAALASSRSLRFLDLGQSRVTTKSVAALARLRSLRVLSLRGCKMRAGDKAKLQKALPRCSVAT